MYRCRRLIVTQHHAKPYNISNIIWLNRFGASSGLLVGYRAQICNQPDHLQHCIQGLQSLFLGPFGTSATASLGATALPSVLLGCRLIEVSLSPSTLPPRVIYDCLI